MNCLKFKNPIIGKRLKEKLPLYIRDMLFNYSKCECCKKHKKDVSFTFYDLLPANVCDKISSYNVYCNQCCVIRDLENFFVEEHKDKGYTKFQLQLKFFMQYQQRFPIYFYHKIARTSFEKEVDKFFENENLIRRFNGADKIKPIKAFIKRGRNLCEMIDWHLLSKDKLEEIFNEFGVCKRSVFTYYNKPYRVSILLNLVFWEYIYAIIGEKNIKYIEIDDIEKYCDDIFYKITPDEEYFNS